MKTSIQNKIIIYFSIVIFIGLSSLLYGSYRITEQNILNIVRGELITTKKNLDLYLKQHFAINNVEFNSMSLTASSQNISNELSSEIGNYVEIYDSNGTKLLKNIAPFNISNKEDLILATKGNIAYSINYVEDTVIISLSYPIKINNSILGIIRYYKDYSQIYRNIYKLKYFINVFATIIFILIFILSTIISKQITKPIRQLTESSKQLAEGNFNVPINIKAKDEIGTLANRFNLMIHRIKNQIETIENDRNELRRTQAQNKIFFDNVTHELKTPITTILGYSQIIQENGFTDKDFFDRGMSYIINASNHLNKMVIEILELSKATSKKFNYNFHKINLSNLIFNTCEEMKIKGRKYNINICYNVEQNLLVNGDKSKLKEVLINILDNALKYGYVNSIVYVSAYASNDIILIKIRNKGEVIPEKHLSNIFEPFYRISKNTSREKGSAGLGLAIVKNIMEKHNGKITITSNIQNGTEITIELKGATHE